MLIGVSRDKVLGHINLIKNNYCKAKAQIRFAEANPGVEEFEEAEKLYRSNRR